MHKYICSFIQIQFTEKALGYSKPQTLWGFTINVFLIAIWIQPCFENEEIEFTRQDKAHCIISAALALCRSCPIKHYVFFLFFKFTFNLMYIW